MYKKLLATGIMSVVPFTLPIKEKPCQELQELLEQTLQNARGVGSVASVAISCSSGGSIQETDCQHQQHNHLYFYHNASHMFYNRGWCNTSSLDLVSGLIT